ncbi:MAG: nucleotidyltransferase family protein [Ruminococcaceae bacterium]|jgi:glucose-1-phosphate thymidylyltransferase|nr:nucleotidyltransferase family protein [Oscillospiraceae bacterium]
MKAIILAAGYATRLYPLTRNKPKPLLPIGQRPMIDYLIDQAETIPGLDDIIVISNHRFVDQFKEWAAGRSATHVPITILDDGTDTAENRLGAVGDIQFCIEQCALDDDLLVMAGDNLFTWPLIDAYKHFRRYGEDMILAQPLAHPEDAHRFAIAEVDDQGIVTHLEEKPLQPRSNLAVYAVYFYRRDTLPLFAQYLRAGNNPDAPGYFPAWLYQRKPVRVYFFQGACIDIGTPETYQDVMTTFRLSATDAHQGEDQKKEKQREPLP